MLLSGGQLCRHLGEVTVGPKIRQRTHIRALVQLPTQLATLRFAQLSVASCSNDRIRGLRRIRFLLVQWQLKNQAGQRFARKRRVLAVGGTDDCPDRQVFSGGYEHDLRSAFSAISRIGAGFGSPFFAGLREPSIDN